MQALIGMHAPTQATLQDVRLAVLQLDHTVKQAIARGDLVSVVQNPTTFRPLRQQVAAVFVNCNVLARTIADNELFSAAQPPAVLQIRAAADVCRPFDLVTEHVLHSEDGRRFWLSKWSVRKLAVPFDALVTALSADMGTTLLPTHIQSLRSVMDDAGCKFVTVHKFNEFLTAFGPRSVKEAVTNVERATQVCSAPLFRVFFIFLMQSHIYTALGACECCAAGLCFVRVLQLSQVLRSALCVRAFESHATEFKLYVRLGKLFYLITVFVYWYNWDVCRPEFLFSPSLRSDCFASM